MYEEQDVISNKPNPLTQNNHKIPTGILPDNEIIRLCGSDEPMIDPFVPTQVREDENGKKVISYGTSSYGYDIRLAPVFKIFTNINSAIIDPHYPSDKTYVDVQGESCILPPNSYILGHSLEYFRMPPDVIAIALGKSTWARCGAIVNVTPLEPGWEGQLVVEISNATNCPLKIYANEGIAQLLFIRGEATCDTTYGARNGKYQGQKGVTIARV